MGRALLDEPTWGSYRLKSGPPCHRSLEAGSLLTPVRSLGMKLSLLCTILTQSCEGGGARTIAPILQMGK